MTTRQLFHKLMKERRQHPRGTAEHEYLTRSARKIAWIALGVPTTEWRE